MKRRLLTEDSLALLSMVKVNVLRSPIPMELGEKLFVNPGRVKSTSRVALAEPLFPALDVKSPEVFVWNPGVLLVTLTVTVQLSSAASCPLLKVMMESPSVATTCPAWQVVAAFEGDAIVIPCGRLSVKAISDSCVAGSPLVIVNKRVLVLPGPMVAGPKDFANAGGFAVCNRTLPSIPPEEASEVVELGTDAVFRAVMSTIRILRTRTVTIEAMAKALNSVRTGKSLDMGSSLLQSMVE